MTASILYLAMEGIILLGIISFLVFALLLVRSSVLSYFNNAEFNAGVLAEKYFIFIENLAIMLLLAFVLLVFSVWR